jgi:uncharacterized membrane protein YfcA
MANLRLAMPLALAGSTASFAGALVGLSAPANILQTTLGVTVVAVALLLWNSRAVDNLGIEESDPLGTMLRLKGRFEDPAAGVQIDWRTNHTLAGLASFALIGFLGGVFGLGAGFANVPALNLLMGAPLKVAVGSSGLIISIVNSSAAWVYINSGAVLPLIVVPSILGVMLGSRIGATLLHTGRRARPAPGDGNMDLKRRDEQDQRLQEIYARWLDIAAKACFAASLIALLLYVSGAMTPFVPLAELPALWSLPVARYLESTGAPSGWGWIRLLGSGDYLNLLGIASFASVSIVCYLRALPVLLSHRDWLYVVIAAAQIVVLLAAASGLLNSIGGG